jgi:hypothetical protein
MATCNNCGQEIEFRYIDGRCVPIHSDGGWHCGSWSNESSSGVSPYSSTPRVREWKLNDFCRPTICPECGGKVFFIRHNGGSVWVDELGWPWPKHGCFDDPHSQTSVFSRWSVKASGFKNPKLGVIGCLRPSQHGQEKFVEIRLHNSMTVGLFLNWMPSDNSLIGALVCLSVEDKLLLHPAHGEIAFHRYVEISTTGNNKINSRPPNAPMQCPRCKTWIITKNQEKHDKENCPKPR